MAITIYVRLMLYSAAAALCFGAGWRWRTTTFEAQAHVQEMARLSMLKAKQDQIDDLELRLTAQAANQVPVVKTITREVTKYVSSPDRTVCHLSGRFRMLHNAAAAGVDPESASVTAAASEAVDDASVLSTVAENYATCQDNASRLTGWQIWWKKVSAGHDD